MALVLSLTALPPSISEPNTIIQKAQAQTPSHRSTAPASRPALCPADGTPILVESKPITVSLPSLRCSTRIDQSATYELLDEKKLSYSENERLIKDVLAPLCHVSSLASQLQVLASCGADVGRVGKPTGNTGTPSATAPVGDWAQFRQQLFRLKSEKKTARSPQARELLQRWTRRLTRQSERLLLYHGPSTTKAAPARLGLGLRPITLREIVSLVLDNELDGKKLSKAKLNGSHAASFLPLRFEVPCALGPQSIGFNALNACFGQIESVRSGPAHRATYTTRFRSDKVLAAPQPPLSLSNSDGTLRLERLGGCKQSAAFIRVKDLKSNDAIADIPILLTNVCSNQITPTPLFTTEPSRTQLPNPTAVPVLTTSPLATAIHTITPVAHPTPRQTEINTPPPPAPSRTPTATSSPTQTPTATPSTTPTPTPTEPPIELIPSFPLPEPYMVACSTEASAQAPQLLAKNASSDGLGAMLKKLVRPHNTQATSTPSPAPQSCTPPLSPSALNAQKGLQVLSESQGGSDPFYDAKVRAAATRVRMFVQEAGDPPENDSSSLSAVRPMPKGSEIDLLGSEAGANCGAPEPNPVRVPLVVSNTTVPTRGRIVFVNPSDENLCIPFMRLPRGMSLPTAPLLSGKAPFVIPAHGQLELSFNDLVPDLVFDAADPQFCEGKIAQILGHERAADLLQSVFIISDCTLPTPTPLRRMVVPFNWNRIVRDIGSKCDLTEMLPALYGETGDDDSDSDSSLPFKDSELKDLFGDESCPEGTREVEQPGTITQCGEGPQKLVCIRDPKLDGVGQCPEGQHEVDAGGPSCDGGAVAAPLPDPDAEDPVTDPPKSCACDEGVFRSKTGTCTPDPCNPDTELFDPCADECLKICPGDTQPSPGGDGNGNPLCECPGENTYANKVGRCQTVPECSTDRVLQQSEETGDLYCIPKCPALADYDATSDRCTCKEGYYADPFGRCEVIPTCEPPEVAALNQAGFAECLHPCTDLFHNVTYDAASDTCQCNSGFYFDPDKKDCVPTNCLDTQYWDPSEKKCHDKCPDGGTAYTEERGNGWRCCPRDTELQGDVCVPKTLCSSGTCYNPDSGSCDSLCPSGSNFDNGDCVTPCVDTGPSPESCYYDVAPVTCSGGLLEGDGSDVSYDSSPCLECPPGSELIDQSCRYYYQCETNTPCVDLRTTAPECAGDDTTSPTTGYAASDSGESLPPNAYPQLGKETAPRSPQDPTDYSVEPLIDPSDYSGPKNYAGPVSSTNPDPNADVSDERHPFVLELSVDTINDLINAGPSAQSLNGHPVSEPLRELLKDPNLLTDPNVRATIEKIDSILNATGGSPSRDEDLTSLVHLVETLRTTVEEFYSGSNQYVDYSQFEKTGWSQAYDEVLSLFSKYRKESASTWSIFFPSELRELEEQIGERILELAQHLETYSPQLTPLDRDRADSELDYLMAVWASLRGVSYQTGRDVGSATLLYLDTWRATNDAALSVVLSTYALRLKSPEAAALAAAYAAYTTERIRNLKNTYIRNWNAGMTRDSFLDVARAHASGIRDAEVSAMRWALATGVTVEILTRGKSASGLITNAQRRAQIQAAVEGLQKVLGIVLTADVALNLVDGLNNLIAGLLDNDSARIDQAWVQLTDAGLDGAQLINLHALVTKLGFKVSRPPRHDIPPGRGLHGERNVKRLTTEQQAALDDKVRGASERLQAEHPQADPQEIVEQLVDKATKELSGKLQQAVGSALKDTFPTISGADMGRALSKGSLAKDIIDQAAPGLRISNPDLFDSKVKEFVDRLDQRQAAILQNWIHWPLELNTPPRVYPPNSPDKNLLWPVTPRFNPSSDPRPKTVTKEIKQGTYQPETGYIKNPSAKRLGSEMSVDPQGRLIGPDTGMPLPDGKYIFAVTPDGSMVIGLRTNRTYPHPTLIGGFDPRVKTAGELRIKDGRVVEIDNQTGHFQVDYDSLYHAVASLRQAWRAQHPTATGDPFKEIALIQWRTL